MICTYASKDNEKDNEKDNKKGISHIIDVHFLLCISSPKYNV